MKKLLVALALITFCIAGCARAPEYDVVIRHGTVYDGTGARGERRGSRHRRRPRGRARRSQRRPGPPGDRRDRARRRPRLHQHAEPLGDVAHRRRPLAGRHPAGRHARSVRRGLDGTDHRADENRADRAPGRHQVRHHVDDARRVSGSPGDARHLAQRRVVRQRRDGARQRDRPGEPAAERRRARADARPRPARDGRGRDGPHLRAHLHAGRLREDRRAGRAGEGRVGIRRHVHLAHAQRRQPAARSDRRGVDDRARGAASGRRSIT